MKSGATLADAFFSGMGYENHVPAEEGDFMGADGRLHCGKCRESKEYFLKPIGKYVPSLCLCGRRARDAEEQRMRDAAEMDRVKDLSRYSLMDEKQRSASFATAKITSENSSAYNIAKRYVAKFDEIRKRKDDMRGLMLYGPTGTGKSYLAACIANALMEQRVPVLFTSIIKLTGYGSDELNVMLEQMNRARLLVLDDLGAERGTDFKLEQVYAVIDKRANSRNPLIVTTNMPLEQMTETGDIRYSRIWERVRAMCYPIRMNSESWRREQSRQAIDRFKEFMK